MPFVADLIGVFATLFLFASVISLLCAFILFDKEDDKGGNGCQK